MKNFLKSFALILVALLVIAGAAAVLVPWKTLVAERLKDMLAANGLKNVELTVAAIGPSTITLKDLSTGGDHPLELGAISLDYTLDELVKGHLQALTLSKLNLEARQEKDGWLISGLSEIPATASAAPLSFPVAGQELAAIPFGTVKLEDSNFRLVMPEGHLDVPLQLTWQRQPLPKLVYGVENIGFSAKDVQVGTGKADLDLTLDEKARKWVGGWQIKNIAVKSDAMTLPPLNGAGTLDIYSDHLDLAGQFKSDDNAYRADFKLAYTFADPAAAQLLVSYATLPWNEGSISVRDVAIPLVGKKDIKIKLNVVRVSLDALLQTLTGKQATATGTVSGTLPVIFKADGSIVVEAGLLKSEAPGTIALSPEAIPGDNEQVALVRDILKNLHYAVLSVTASSGKDRQLGITMTLEGHNPDVYEGKPVKLNVQLTGDVLNFIQQSVMSLIDPKYFLKTRGIGKDEPKK